MSLIAFAVLTVLGFQNGFLALFTGTVYGLSLVQLFAISTIYHSAKTGELKRKLRLLDHCSIYVLIAGSYTPFMLLGLGDWRGVVMTILIWGLALYGIRFKCTHANPFGIRSVLLYLVMGWMVMLVYKPLRLCLTPAAGTWLLGGGLIYTGGILFYAWQNLRQSHAMWHLFVLGGAFCHFVAALSLF